MVAGSIPARVTTKALTFQGFFNIVLSFVRRTGEMTPRRPLLKSNETRDNSSPNLSELAWLGDQIKRILKGRDLPMPLLQQALHVTARVVRNYPWLGADMAIATGLLLAETNTQIEVCARPANENGQVQVTQGDLANLERFQRDSPESLERNVAWVVSQQKGWWPPRFVRRHAARTRLELLATRFILGLED